MNSVIGTAYENQCPEVDAGIILVHAANSVIRGYLDLGPHRHSN